MLPLAIFTAIPAACLVATAAYTLRPVLPTAARKLRLSALLPSPRRNLPRAFFNLPARTTPQLTLRARVLLVLAANGAVAVLGAAAFLASAHDADNSSSSRGVAAALALAVSPVPWSVGVIAVLAIARPRPSVSPISGKVLDTGHASMLALALRAETVLTRALPLTLAPTLVLVALCAALPRHAGIVLLTGTGAASALGLGGTSYAAWTAARARLRLVSRPGTPLSDTGNNKNRTMEAHGFTMVPHDLSASANIDFSASPRTPAVPTKNTRTHSHSHSHSRTLSRTVSASRAHTRVVSKDSIPFSVWHGPDYVTEDDHTHMYADWSYNEHEHDNDDAALTAEAVTAEAFSVTPDGLTAEAVTAETSWGARDDDALDDIDLDTNSDTRSRVGSLPHISYKTPGGKRCSRGSRTSRTSKRSSDGTLQYGEPTPGGHDHSYSVIAKYSPDPQLPLPPHGFASLANFPSSPAASELVTGDGSVDTSISMEGTHEAVAGGGLPPPPSPPSGAFPEFPQFIPLPREAKTSDGTAYTLRSYHEAKHEAYNNNNNNTLNSLLSYRTRYSEAAGDRHNHTVNSVNTLMTYHTQSDSVDQAHFATQSSTATHGSFWHDHEPNHYTATELGHGAHPHPLPPPPRPAGPRPVFHRAHTSCPPGPVNANATRIGTTPTTFSAEPLGAGVQPLPSPSTFAATPTFPVAWDEEQPLESDWVGMGEDKSADMITSAMGSEAPWGRGDAWAGVLAIVCLLLCYGLDVPLLVLGSSDATLAAFTAGVCLPAPLLAVAACLMDTRSQSTPGDKQHAHHAALSFPSQASLPQSLPRPSQRTGGSNDAVLPLWHARHVGATWDAANMSSPSPNTSTTHWAPDMTSGSAYAGLANGLITGLPGRTAMSLRRHTVHVTAANAVLRDMNSVTTAELWLRSGQAREGGRFARAAEMLKPVPALCVLGGSTAPARTHKSADRSAGILARLRGGVVSMLPPRRGAAPAPPVSVPVLDTEIPVIVTTGVSPKSSPHKSEKSHRRGGSGCTESDAEIHVATHARRSPSPSFIFTNGNGSGSGLPDPNAKEQLRLDWISGGMLRHGLVPGLVVGSDVAVDQMPLSQSPPVETRPSNDSMPDFRPSLDALASGSTPPSRQRAVASSTSRRGAHKVVKSTSTTQGTPQSITDFTQPRAVDYSTPRGQVSGTSGGKLDMDSSIYRNEGLAAEQSIIRNAALARTYLDGGSYDDAEASRQWSSLRNNSSFLRDVRAGQSFVATGGPPSSASGHSPWSSATHLAIPAIAQSPHTPPTRRTVTRAAAPADSPGFLLPSPGDVRNVSFCSDVNESGIEEMEGVLALDTPARDEYVRRPSVGSLPQSVHSVHSGHSARSHHTHHSHHSSAPSTPPSARLPPIPSDVPAPAFPPTALVHGNTTAHTHPAVAAYNTMPPHPALDKLFRASGMMHADSPDSVASSSAYTNDSERRFSRKPLAAQFEFVENYLYTLGNGRNKDKAKEKGGAARPRPLPAPRTHAADSATPTTRTGLRPLVLVERQAGDKRKTQDRTSAELDVEVVAARVRRPRLSEHNDSTRSVNVVVSGRPSLDAASNSRASVNNRQAPAPAPAPRGGARPSLPRSSLSTSAGSVGRSKGSIETVASTRSKVSAGFGYGYSLSNGSKTWGKGEGEGKGRGSAASNSNSNSNSYSYSYSRSYSTNTNSAAASTSFLVHPDSPHARSKHGSARSRGSDKENSFGQVFGHPIPAPVPTPAHALRQIDNMYVRSGRGRKVHAVEDAGGVIRG